MSNTEAHASQQPSGATANNHFWASATWSAIWTAGMGYLIKTDEATHDWIAVRAWVFDMTFYEVFWTYLILHFVVVATCFFAALRVVPKLGLTGGALRLGTVIASILFATFGVMALDSVF